MLARGGALMFGAELVAGPGIGAGALKVLIHDLVMGLPPKVSTTTSNLTTGNTLAGTSVYLANGLIDPGLAAPCYPRVYAILLGNAAPVRLANQTV